MVLSSWTLAHAGVDPGALRDAWARDADAIAADSGVPIRLDDDDLEQLGEGRVVSHRLDTPEGAFALGAVWLDTPIAEPWLCVQDAKDRPLGEGVTNEWLPGGTPDHRDVFMHLSLPWPLADRQWVADLRPNRALFDATGGRVWQRAWTLGDPTEAKDADPKAVWVTTNTGAWTMLPASGGTLVVFGVRTLLGGAIPQGLSQAGALAKIDGTLRSLAEQARTAAQHYGAGHEPVYAPDGVRLPPGLGLMD